MIVNVFHEMQILIDNHKNVNPFTLPLKRSLFGELKAHKFLKRKYFNQPTVVFFVYFNLFPILKTIFTTLPDIIQLTSMYLDVKYVRTIFLLL